MSVERAAPSPFNFPPTLAVMLAALSIQGGAALAKSLFPLVGPFGVSALRIGFAAVILALLWRPNVRSHSRSDLGLAVLFGLCLGLMNLAFYASIERIPIGIAVTIEFIGPLGVAVMSSKRKLDFLWVVLAAVGILLIAPVHGGSTLDPVGVGLALLAAGFWGAYILLGARVSKAFSGGHGLAIGMIVAALVALPIGVVQAGADLFVPATILLGLGVALLSSAIPYSLEMAALRRLSSKTFSILMSLEPAIAATVGFLFLREALTPQQLVAMALVIAASVGASVSAGR